MQENNIKLSFLLSGFQRLNPSPWRSYKQAQVPIDTSPFLRTLDTTASKLDFICLPSSDTMATSHQTNRINKSPLRVLGESGEELEKDFERRYKHDLTGAEIKELFSIRGQFCFGKCGSGCSVRSVRIKNGYICERRVHVLCKTLHQYLNRIFLEITSQ